MEEAAWAGYHSDGHTKYGAWGEAPATSPVMRKIFYVDREMCGGESLPADFDLEDFCEILQGKLGDVEVVPVTAEEEPAWNRCSNLVAESVFNEALGEYYHR